ncbi:threonine-phosphate decarboxylase CobD [Falsirhodobacter xinxiangensis]|uniref:threonine-phosphate decarboxylase CobD n=1 Tax=Falsirhodobacter xinxiangensis TaxID=2530049 RepID=UPI0010AAB298|nr:threonine-phosphate decarboxylase CobD [Rhodobacter xinxiangensis]
MTRDHGGNIDAAMERFGGTGWIDLSTGINRCPYPIPPLPPEAWTALPTACAKAALIAAARKAWGCTAPMLATAGAQAAIQMIPRLRPSGLARVLSPTYNEHAATLAAAGWRVEPCADLAALSGADLAVLVNPNNPDGQSHAPEALAALDVGLLVVDESFADPVPDLSLLAQAGRPGLLVLRSFGKFYGLAGVRLGFVAGHEADIAALGAMAGPWPVSGAALEIGRVALADADWAGQTARRLAEDARRADALASGAGWRLVGGAHLFRLYDAGDAVAAQERLARHRIWSRIFPWHDRWLRLGLPGTEEEWARLSAALGK